MNAPNFLDSQSSTSHDVAQACDVACSYIAPAWPLDQLIAVNPFWGLVDKPIEQASAWLTARCCAPLVMPRAWYLSMWQRGEFGREDLIEAIREEGSGLRLDIAIDHLHRAPRHTVQSSRFKDVVDQSRDVGRFPSWRDLITQRVGHVCAAYFDSDTSRVKMRARPSLYATWKSIASWDALPRLSQGSKDYQAQVNRLPSEPLQVIWQALNELQVPREDWERYLHALLLDVNGWASHCAYRKFQAQQADEADDTILELLAVMCAWELLLLRMATPSQKLHWSLAVESWKSLESLAQREQRKDWLFQRALELAWRRKLVAQLQRRDVAPSPVVSAPSIQAIFCIDVRSEVFRRNLEAQTSNVRTLGFAGFFGLPIAVQDSASATTQRHVPGLLSPKYRVVDGEKANHTEDRHSIRASQNARRWSQFRTGSMSSFVFVEALGLASAAKLLTRSVLKSRERRQLRSGDLRLVNLSDDSPVSLDVRVELAANMLRSMSLTRDFAQVVVLVGHTSETCNQPFARALNCGACGGQSGEVNAAVAAMLLNDTQVREALRSTEIEIPRATVFVSALHNTTTDTILWPEEKQWPSSLAPEQIESVRQVFAAATISTRKERAPKLGLVDLDDTALEDALVQKSGDWSQVRPEWGLAGNAAIVFGPRELTQHANLEGRVFLHEYEAALDPQYKILEALLCAPMLVSHWINMQYFASTVAPQVYSSGNKVLHNVVGSRIGVVEGIGEDLRTGLPLQSLHDGDKLVHVPLRLTVVVAAPCEAIAELIGKHQKLRDLVENRWIHLVQIDVKSRRMETLRNDSWHQVTG